MTNKSVKGTAMISLVRVKEPGTRREAVSEAGPLLKRLPPSQGPQSAMEVQRSRCGASGHSTGPPCRRPGADGFATKMSSSVEGTAS